ncbi:DivIVA domain-containing protein [Streptosporangium sp. NPDC051022]|uniref:DivIVA domain-containing protein n=1 Tax=Streptosporangium sp. NPDC051022 TaxID=3155752 RepID=UPI0034320A4F
MGHGDHEHPPAPTAGGMSGMHAAANLGGKNRLLTPHDIRNKVFPTVRLREGYDLAEVDTFLGEVEATLSRVFWENEQLNVQLTAISHTSRQASPSTGDSAARIVARAQQSADETIMRAEQEAVMIVAEARTLAETIEREALDRATALEQETQERHRQAVQALDDACTVQRRRIDDLHDLVLHHGDRVLETLDGHVGQLQNLLQSLKDQTPRLPAPTSPEPPHSLSPTTPPQAPQPPPARPLPPATSPRSPQPTASPQVPQVTAPTRSPHPAASPEAFQPAASPQSSQPAAAAQPSSPTVRAQAPAPERPSTAAPQPGLTAQQTTQQSPNPAGPRARTPLNELLIDDH